MRVIFLDFDGVLNNAQTFRRYWSDDSDLLCPILADRVQRIANTTKAKIVISSAWRSGRTISNLANLMDSIGIDGRLIIDKTPDRKTWINRWTEIAEWLIKHEDDNIESFVILDDIPNFDVLRKHHVKTDEYKGLLEKDIQKAIDILNGGWNILPVKMEKSA